MMTTAFNPMEIVITPYTTYVLIESKARSDASSPTDANGAARSSRASGLPIGRWIDEAGAEVYDLLEV
jgi:hypothetical protein